MSNYYIRTNLEVSPMSSIRKGNKYIVTRGATSEFVISFDEYPYLKPAIEQYWWWYIEQMTFIFKFENGDIISYKLYPVDKKDQHLEPDQEPDVNERFGFDYDRNCVSFLLNPEDTADWPVSIDEEEVEYEVAIYTDTYIEDIDVDPETLEEHPILVQKVDSLIVEPQDPVIVVDSLYRKVNYPED